MPLLDDIADKLLELKEKQEAFKNAFGKTYNRKYLDYVFVNPQGRLICPDYISEHFSILLNKIGMKHIRFHDLRHSCASIMLKNGVPMKQIQEWLGHADFGTTANIYSHLDYTTKMNSANTISNVFGFVGENKKEQSKEVIEKDDEEKVKDRQELLDEIERLQNQIKQQQEDQNYLEWLKEKELRRQKRKQSDMEM